VIKQGPKCAGQLEYLDRLAAVASDRVPEILARWDDGFAMELLLPCPTDPEWASEAAYIAAASFWNHRPAVSVSTAEWRSCLRDTLEIEAPDWTWIGERPCAVHGDLTLCNTMLRQTEHGRTMVFGDPVYPERVPQIAVVDQARIVQSMMGWEIMTGYQTEHVVWHEPSFLYVGNNTIPRIAFWVFVMMSRIAASPNALEERVWASHIRDQLREHLS